VRNRDGGDGFEQVEQVEQVEQDSLVVVARHPGSRTDISR